MQYLRWFLQQLLYNIYIANSFWVKVPSQGTIPWVRIPSPAQTFFEIELAKKMLINQRRRKMGNTLRQSQIQEFLLFKSSIGASDAYIRRCSYELRYFKTWLGEKEVTPVVMLQYLSYLHKQPISDWYRKSNAQTLKACLNYLRSVDYDYPLPDFRLPRIHRKKMCYLRPEDIKKLLKTNLSPKELLIIRLLISTGLRLSECCDLEWRDINFSTGVIDVRHGKGDKFRVVVTDKPTLALLLRYKNKFAVADQPSVLCLQPMGLRSAIVRIRNKTGIFFTAHALRRTFARQAVIAGMDIIWVQQLMGHSSIEMTRQYVHQLDTEDLVKTYNQHLPIGI